MKNEHDINNKHYNKIQFPRDKYREIIIINLKYVLGKRILLLKDQNKSLICFELCFRNDIQPLVSSFNELNVRM